MKSFSVDYAGLYINWANTLLFIILVTPLTLKLPIKPTLHQGNNFF